MVDSERIVVLANGCFDGLHLGHVKHLQLASSMGDYLVVGLTEDGSINKGPDRPFFPWEERRDMLMALRCVDEVIMCFGPREAIRMVLPNIYVKGIEYKNCLPERRLVEELGGEVRFLDTQPVYSSTRLFSGQHLRERSGIT